MADSPFRSQERLSSWLAHTTQLYTQVAHRKLKEIHDATHPGARPASRRTVAVDDDPEATAQADLRDALDTEAQEADDGTPGAELP